MSSVSKAEIDDIQEGTGKRLPGEPGIWILIFGDMVIFGLFFGTFLFYRSQDVATFAASQQSLNLSLGLLNTLLLLTSSWFVVWAVRCVKHQALPQARTLFKIGMALGLVFWAVKVIEYREKILDGQTIITNEFFGFYYMFTGIHLLHVTVGLGALYFVIRILKDGRTDSKTFHVVEGIGAFWHMVDLLWIVLFTLLYLVK